MLVLYINCLCEVLSWNVLFKVGMDREENDG